MRAPVTKMKQMPLPFDQEFVPGWKGARYLKCTDGKWHLVLEIREGRVADTQCCEDVRLHESPTSDEGNFPMCEVCVSLQFPEKKANEKTPRQ
jgi:hypothetical protein